MSESKAALKNEILAELRKDIRSPGRGIQYLNVTLLVFLGASAGFLVGRRYERTLHRVLTRPGAAPQQMSQIAPGTPMPADHPPVEQAGGGQEGQAMMNAVMELRARVEANPEDLEAIIELANLNFEIGRMDMAVELYQRAIAIDPTNPDVLTDMGISYRRMGRFDDALQAFELAISLDETHFQSRLNRGIVLLMDKGDVLGAIAAFEDYLTLGPDVPRRDAVERQLQQLRQDVSGEARLHGPPTPAAETRES